MLPWFKVWWHGQKSLCQGTKIILDFESTKYFCLWQCWNCGRCFADYVFDFDPSSGTVLNQLNLPVLFLLLTALWLCFRVSFSSVLYQQLCQGFSAASKNVPQESTLMTTTRNRRIYLWWWLDWWRRDVTKKFRSACENKIVPNTIILLVVSTVVIFG